MKDKFLLFYCVRCLVQPLWLKHLRTLSKKPPFFLWLMVRYRRSLGCCRTTKHCCSISGWSTYTGGGEGETFWKRITGNKTPIISLLMLLMMIFILYTKQVEMITIMTNWKFISHVIYRKKTSWCRWNLGHYQIAPGFVEAEIDGTDKKQPDRWCRMPLCIPEVTEPNYVAEYFVPMTNHWQRWFPDSSQNAEIGFDITVIDRDNGDNAARKRMDWAIMLVH